MSRPGVDTVLSLRGVADQDTTCQHGTEGCPGPGGPAPCAECFFAGGGERG
jgi:hypothetical protein